MQTFNPICSKQVNKHIISHFVAVTAKVSIAGHNPKKIKHFYLIAKIVCKSTRYSICSSKNQAAEKKLPALFSKIILLIFAMKQGNS